MLIKQHSQINVKLLHRIGNIKYFFLQNCKAGLRIRILSKSNRYSRIRIRKLFYGCTVDCGSVSPIGANSIHKCLYSIAMDKIFAGCPVFSITVYPANHTVSSIRTDTRCKKILDYPASRKSGESLQILSFNLPNR